jgi:hypothetical protein
LPMIVQSSDVCEMYLQALLAWIAAGPSFWLCLYSNDLPLSPDSENPLSYVEASYGGYARFGTPGSWGSVIRDNPGIYHIQSGAWTFNVNTGPVAQNVFGWFLLRGTRVVFAERFGGAPIIINVGSPGPTLLLQLTQGAQSVICPGP